MICSWLRLATEAALCPQHRRPQCSPWSGAGCACTLGWLHTGAALWGFGYMHKQLSHKALMGLHS